MLVQKANSVSASALDRITLSELSTYAELRRREGLKAKYADDRRREALKAGQPFQALEEVPPDDIKRIDNHVYQLRHAVNKAGKGTDLANASLDAAIPR